MRSSSAPASSFFESIAANAEVNDEITTAFSIRPTPIVNVVMMASSAVTGSMSRGTIDVTIPAPQKNECQYLGLNSGAFFSHGGGCQVFSPAYHAESQSCSDISRSEISHQRQPNQWQQSSEIRQSLMTRNAPGLNLMISSTYSRYFASLNCDHSAAWRSFHKRILTRARKRGGREREGPKGGDVCVRARQSNSGQS